MRPRRPVGASSQTERLARSSAELQALPTPPGLSPLRLRLLRLCLDGSGMPCPEKLSALRRITLREALHLEDVAHHRQREALLLQDALQQASTALAKTPRVPPHTGPAPTAEPDFSDLPPISITRTHVGPAPGGGWGGSG